MKLEELNGQQRTRAEMLKEFFDSLNLASRVLKVRIPPELTSQLMLYREIIAVCFQIHTKHINTLCGQNVELLNVKLAVYKDPVRTAQ